MDVDDYIFLEKDFNAFSYLWSDDEIAKRRIEKHKQRLAYLAACEAAEEKCVGDLGIACDSSATGDSALVAE